MKRFTLALLAGLMSISANANTNTNTNSATFTWAGTVPTFDSKGFWIVPVDGSKPFQDGSLTFKNDGRSISLENSDTLSFEVRTDKNVDGNPYNPTEDEQASSFYYSLASLKVGIVGINGELQSYGGDYFQISANDNKINDNTPKQGLSAISLRVIANEAETADFQAKDKVTVQAVITVTDVTF